MADSHGCVVPPSTQDNQGNLSADGDEAAAAASFSDEFCSSNSVKKNKNEFCCPQKSISELLRRARWSFKNTGVCFGAQFVSCDVIKDGMVSNRGSPELLETSMQLVGAWKECMTLD